MSTILCQICDEAVGLGGELLPTGALCVECAGKEPKAPTHNPNEGGDTTSVSLPPATEGVDNSASHAPRAAEEHTESKGEPAPQAAGDRAAAFVESGDVAVAYLRPFEQPKTRQVPSIVVEEWIYGFIVGQDAPVVLRTPREIYPGLAAEMLQRLGEFCRFVVVMEWQQYAGQNVDLRDIGPSFTPRGLTLADRAAALNTAKAWANGQCRRMRLPFPTIFRAAREFPIGPEV